MKFNCCYVTIATLCFRWSTSGFPGVASIHESQRCPEAKARCCYDLLFRNFIGFCMCSHIEINCITIDHVMAYLEYLVQNGVTVHMVSI